MSDGGGALLLCLLVSAIPTLAALLLTVILWSRREPRGSLVDLAVATSGMAVAGTLTWEITPWVLLSPLVAGPGVLVGVAWMATSILLARGSPHFARVGIAVAVAVGLFHLALVVLLAMNAPPQTDQRVLAIAYLALAIPAAAALAVVAARARRRA